VAMVVANPPPPRGQALSLHPGTSDTQIRKVSQYLREPVPLDPPARSTSFPAFSSAGRNI
jgi:hypothetical protein